MRGLASFCGLLLLVGCTCPRQQFSDATETRSAPATQPASSTIEPPNLKRAEVLQMAVDYAHEKEWDIINVWSGMPEFDGARRVWRVFINTKQNGGPMIICIKDSTKEISFTRGE